MSNQSASAKKQAAIETIEALFPVDSPFEITADTGRRILFEAFYQIRFKFDWRDLPEPLILKYAELCKVESYEQERGF